jgi:hypothetical protein
LGKIIELRDLLAKAEMIRSTLGFRLDEAQCEGLNDVTYVVKNGGMSVGVGPPGTGKTVVFNLAQRELFDALDDYEVMIYVAPTNRLVEDCAVRTLAHLLSKGFEKSELREFIRAYGSRFKAEPPTRDVRIILTTPYQPGMLRDLLETKRTVHLMIDEASTTPWHEPFIELAMSMVKAIREKRLEWLHSFSVIGDPMQAVVEEYKPWEKLEMLIVGRVLMASLPQDERSLVREDLSKIFELAKKYAPSVGVKYFFLNNSYRIPKPTELLVSIPFYSGLLKGVEEYKRRLKGIRREEPGFKSKVLERCKHLKEKRLVEVLDHALNSQIPVVYLRDKGLAYAYRVRGEPVYRRLPEIEELDLFRSKLACEVAAYFLASTIDSVKIEVLTPYVEMKTQIGLMLWQLMGELKEELRQRIKVSTIHSALGSEADIVVVAMGKEYGEYGDKKTIYFQTPELVNVQFSRHRRLLVVIGNIKRLAKGFEKVDYAKNLVRLTEALEELRKQELIKEVTVTI